MTITYFLMLLFVFVTLLFWSWGNKRFFSATPAGFVYAVLYAGLGTLFFHNVW